MNFDSSVLNVAIEDIIPNRNQPRLNFNDESLSDLANSIKQHGIIQPLVLRRMGDKYEIVAGERRYRAAKMAGLAAVPAVISLIDDKKSAEVAIAENIQRTALSPIEEAKSYESLLAQGIMNIQMLSNKLGVSPYYIESKLKLLELPAEVQNALMDNQISEKHAKVLLTLPDKDSQLMWLNKIISEKLNVKTLTEMINGNNKEENGMDINQIKQNATDIIPIQSNSPVETEYSGAIDLGEKKENKFFNNLEDEQVNMKMSEVINPFANLKYMDFGQNNEPEPTPAVEPLMESLDFEPPVQENVVIPEATYTVVNEPKMPSKLDTNKVIQKINLIKQDLEMDGLTVNVSHNEFDGEITFVFTVKDSK